MGGPTVKPTDGFGDGNGAGKPKKWRDKPVPQLFLTKMLVVAYLIGCCMTVFDVETDRHIINHGVRVEGTVESAEFVHQHRSDKTYLVIAYEHPDGTSARFEQVVDGPYEKGAVAEAGDKVTVSYDPHTDPEEAVVEKWRARYSLSLGLFFAGVLLVIGIFEQLFTAASVPSPFPRSWPERKASAKPGPR
ncbi:DUF3592 domain-containing protein [Arthrobacter yangruifuii]|uniref:DUF3592 domain-containing protein n=1 Tax=Arthrobacter yangruifuii TaxID=2606616 RepID=UPI0011B43A39|nr:DUF3592 domain-containing protein [Arthrobacter yangruifuii]